ncbi:MAG: ATP-binding protein [Vicinamibacterales bacterium]
MVDDHAIELDPRLTASALGHVLENAAQYAPAGSPIDVTASVDADGLLLQVRDRGPGIADADLPHVFDRFFRGQTGSMRTSGTGMGLWIARRLLAVQGGRIWVENLVDGGARFSLRVPGPSRPQALPGSVA